MGACSGRRGALESHKVLLGTEDSKGEKATQTKGQELETAGRALAGQGTRDAPGNGGILEAGICICSTSWLSTSWTGRLKDVSLLAKPLLNFKAKSMCFKDNMWLVTSWPHKANGREQTMACVQGISQGSVYTVPGAQQGKAQPREVCRGHPVPWSSSGRQDLASHATYITHEEKHTRAHTTHTHAHTRTGLRERCSKSSKVLKKEGLVQLAERSQGTV